MEIKKIIELMDNVPFGNSSFQILNFTENQTPERQYRNILLQLHQKINALKECEFKRKRINIDIQEIKNKLKIAEGFEKERLEIDIEEKEYHLKSQEKLIKDAMIEINIYNEVLEKLPKFTREEFENAELGYWKDRLENDAKKELISTGTISVGTQQALEKIGINIKKNNQNQLCFEYSEKIKLLKEEK